MDALPAEWYMTQIIVKTQLSRSVKFNNKDWLPWVLYRTMTSLITYGNEKNHSYQLVHYCEGLASSLAVEVFSYQNVLYPFSHGKFTYTAN